MQLVTSSTATFLLLLLDVYTQTRTSTSLEEGERRVKAALIKGIPYQFLSDLRFPPSRVVIVNTERYKLLFLFGHTPNHWTLQNTRRKRKKKRIPTRSPKKSFCAPLPGMTPEKSHDIAV